jgi:hypothetical protein
MFSRYLTGNKLNLIFVEMGKNKIEPAANAGERLDWLEIVRQQVGSLHYGVVQVVVHDSQVTQIEKTERVRLEKAHAQTIWADRKGGA